MHCSAKKGDLHFTNQQTNSTTTTLEYCLSEDGDGGGGPEDNVGQPQRPVPDEDDTKCKICYENRAKVLTMPCRHAVMCEACAQQLADERCPMCRSPIEDTIVIFF